MLNASLLSIIEEAGIAALTLTEGLEKDAFLASRLTRAETRRQVKIMSESLANLSPQTQTMLAEVDWGGWHTVAHLSEDSDGEQEALPGAGHPDVAAGLPQEPAGSFPVHAIADVKNAGAVLAFQQSIGM